MPVNPNPQGKGLTPVLESVGQHQFAHLVRPKRIDQVEMELFTSLFILQSSIRFNPVVGASYWLYQVDGAYRLLLVSPEEWGRAYRGRYIGECVLQEDRTWSLKLAQAMLHDPLFIAQIEQKRDEFIKRLEQAPSVEAALPEYDSSFTFYAKVLSYTLGRSLDASMQLSGVKGLTYVQAKGLLGQDKKE